MSAQDRLDALRAELEQVQKVALLEAELVAAKEADDPDEVQRIKYELRAARQAQREARASDALAAPDAVTATATVEKPT